MVVTPRDDNKIKKSTHDKASRHVDILYYLNKYVSDTLKINSYHVGRLFGLCWNKTEMKNTIQFGEDFVEAPNTQLLINLFFFYQLQDAP